MRHVVTPGTGAPEDILITTGGEANVAEMVANMEKTLTGPLFRPGMRMLIDHRALDWGTLSSDDIAMRVERIITWGDRIGRSKIAVVMGKTVDFGLARMQQAHVEGRVPFELAVFRSLDDARVWLGEALAHDEVDELAGNDDLLADLSPGEVRLHPS
jgi:hypothetical protein